MNHISRRDDVKLGLTLRKPTTDSNGKSVRFLEPLFSYTFLQLVSRFLFPNQVKAFPLYEVSECTNR